MHEVLAVLHVLAAIFIIGPIVAFASSAPRQLRTGDLGGLRASARMLRVYGWASLIVLLLGGAMVRGFGPLWIWLSVVLFVVMFGVLWFVLRPGILSAIGVLETDPAGTPASAPVAAGSGTILLVILVIVVLMVLKPG